MTQRNEALEAKILEAANKCESAFQHYAMTCNRKGAGSQAAGAAKDAWEALYSEMEKLTAGYNFGH